MVSPLLHCLLPLALLCSCFIGSPLQAAYCGNVFADVLAPREDTINGGSGSSEAQLVAQFQDQGDEEEAEYYQVLSESGGLPILSINSCTPEQLREHPLIRPQEAQAIINYRNAYGELSSLHELAYIEGLSPGRIKLLTHLFSLSPSPSSFFSQGFRPQTLEVAQRTLYRLPLGPRYEPKYRSDSTRPLGDPLGLQVRALYKAKDWLKVAFKGTKSPFEPFFRHFNPQGFSSYSGFIQLDLPRVRVERVVAGCYNYRVGHGLLMQSQGLIFPVYDPYSSGRLSVLPQGSLRYPGSSTLMGMGASLRIFEHLRLTAALSVKRLNSRLKHDSIETLSISPTITTLSQAKHRRTTWEAMAIADLQYTIKNLTGGVAFRTLHYSHPFRVADPKRKIAKPSYLQNSQALSAYFAWYGGAVDFYGEILAQVDPSARVPFSWGKGSGLLGVNARLPYSFSITLQAFSFGRENNPIYQEHFSLGSNPHNRWGGRIMLHYSPQFGQQFYLNTLFHCPNDARATPPAGQSVFDLRLGSLITPESQVYRIAAEYRIKCTGLGCGESSGFAMTHHFKSTYRHRISEPVELQLTTAGIYIPGGVGYSWALYPEVQYSNPEWRLQVKCRVGYHQRVGKSSVLRIYESSPRYTFSVATLSHTGFRTYLLLNYRPIHELLLSLKVGKTLYTKAELARLPRAEVAFINGFDILFSLHILSVTR